MGSYFIAYKNSTIHYCVWGKGLKPLFCFHGYGETAETFAVLENHLGADYTIIGLDMPFHGQTQWQEGLLFTDEDLLDIMGKITQAMLRSFASGFSLLGYSMGGRVALQLAQKKPGLVERIVLVAPDGLHKNTWYRFATQNLLGNRLFKYTMYQPQRAFKFFGWIEKAKLVHPGMMKIVRFYTGDEQERQMLYSRWTTMRKFKPRIALLKETIQRHQIPTRFLFGRFDNIILSTRAEVFKMDTHNVQVHIIDAGHRLMQEKHSAVISSLFYQ